MNFTCLSGLVMFAHQAIRYKSFIPFSIFTNGILYHSFPNNKILKYNDIFFNIIYTNLVLYNAEGLLRINAYIAFVVWVYNYKKKGNYNDLLHVYGVQLPLAIGLEEFLRMNKNKKLLY